MEKSRRKTQPNSYKIINMVGKKVSKASNKVFFFLNFLKQTPQMWKTNHKNAFRF